MIDHKYIASILGSEAIDLRTENAELRQEIERLQGIVDRLQLTLQNINMNTEDAGFLNLDQARWKLGMVHKYTSHEDMT